MIMPSTWNGHKLQNELTVTTNDNKHYLQIITMDVSQMSMLAMIASTQQCCTLQKQMNKR